MSARGVLLMAYGTPGSLDDMPAYLADVREGRPPSPALVTEMTQRYRRIGGSPLTRLTLRQAEALEAEFARRGRPARVHVGMRHWEPRIAGAVRDMAAEGIPDAVAIAMAPHYSSLSGARYRRCVAGACDQTPNAPKFRFVGEWWRQPRLIDTWAGLIGDAMRAQAAEGTDAPLVVFTAHSLPARIRAAGDTYEAQLRENAGMIAERAGLAGWTFAFQSAGASPEPWLGPPIGEKLGELAAGGARRVLVAPIGFVCDHVEILFDLDIEAREIAERLGLGFARTALPNDAPGFIAAIADAVDGAWDGAEGGG